MTDPVNYTKEAFLHPGNLVFLLVMAVAGTGASLWSLPPFGGPAFLLGIGLAMEAAYLGIAPRVDRFRRAVRARRKEERRGPPPRRILYRHLPRRSRQRYYRLRTLKNEVQAHYAQLSSASQGLLDAHLRKLDRLLRSYLELLWKREQYRVLAERTSEARIRESIETLDADMADDAERVRSVKQRRRTVLEKRLKRLRTIRENLEVVGAQLGTIEDAVKYIHEQSWTLQDPDEVTMQLDALLEEVDETQRSIRDVERLLSGGPEPVDDDLDALDRELRAATGAPLDGERPPEADPAKTRARD
jgi:hypothetical protein